MWCYQYVSLSDGEFPRAEQRRGSSPVLIICVNQPRNARYCRQGATVSPHNTHSTLVCKPVCRWFASVRHSSCLSEGGLNTLTFEWFYKNVTKTTRIRMLRKYRWWNIFVIEVRSDLKWYSRQSHVLDYSAPCSNTSNTHMSQCVCGVCGNTKHN